MSPRILHFTKGRILWECRACVALEDFPSQVHRRFIRGENTVSDRNWGSQQRQTWRLFDGHYVRYEKKVDWSLKFPRPAVQIAPYAPFAAHRAEPYFKEDIYSRWLKAVELYSARNLTYEFDKLPAISGMAAAVIEIMEDDVYLAGIWGKYLIRGLLWMPALLDAGAPTPKRALHIPSWSWASYCGPITFHASLADRTDHPHNMARCLVDILEGGGVTAEVKHLANIEAETSISGLDRFGSVSGGTLQMTTRIRYFSLGANPLNYSCQIQDEKIAQFFHIHLDDESSQLHSKVVFALLLSGTGFIWTYSFGLLLLQKAQSSTFHRIGIFYTRYVKYVMAKFEEETLIIE